jgi:Lar family restriction alleviation protein
MKTDIKPCPFCGSRKIDVEPVEIEGYNLGYQASCSQCSVSGSNYATEDDAISVWNTRAPVLFPIPKDRKKAHARDVTYD